MSLDFLPSKLQDFLDKRKQQTRKNENNVLATIIKNIRKDKGLTLEDITDGICSKAYLCKFENNLIDIDTDIAKQLCERVSIDYNAIVNIDDEYSLFSVLKCYLYNQVSEVIRLKEALPSSSLFIASNELIKAIHALITDDDKECEIIINNLEKVKTTLTNEEIEIFLIVLNEYLIKTNEYLKAKEFIDVLDYDLFTNKECLMLFKEQKFIISCNLNLYVDANKDYSVLIKENEKSYPMKRQFLDKILFMETFCTKNTVNEFDLLINDYIPQEYYEDYWYSYCISLIKNALYKECLEKILTNNLVSSRFCALYALALCLMVKEETRYDILQVKKSVNLSKYIKSNDLKGFNYLIDFMNKEHKKSIHRTFVKLIQMELMGEDTEDSIDFLRYDALEDDKIKQHRVYSPYYAKLLLVLLGSITHYKDAYTLVMNNRNFKTN